MAIYLPGTAEDQELALEELTPREIVAELDKYVVGQKAAKRAVAIALRNRMPPEAAPRPCRGDHAQEHHHDRAYRRGQD
jgi:ATP-dependent HslUV protease ATP-binding subunit HslU